MTETDTHGRSGAHTEDNTDPGEVEKFDALASLWWDPDGAFKPLHDINPLRLAFVEGAAGLAGRTVLDVGCGGGILAEAMASRGAAVTGIDASEGALATARLHLKESGAEVDYIHATGEQMADERPGAFDVVTAFLGQDFQRTVVLAIRDAELVGFLGQGFGISQQSVQQFKQPIDLP